MTGTAIAAKKMPMWPSRPAMTGSAAVVIVSGSRERDALAAERPGCHVGDDLDRDVVEHDRGHDFVGAGVGLQETRDEAIRGAGRDARQHRERDGGDRRQAGGRHTHRRRRQPSDQELALARRC